MDDSTPDDTALDDGVLRAELRANGRRGEVASVRRLDGGFAAGAWQVSFTDGAPDCEARSKIDSFFDQFPRFCPVAAKAA